MQLTKPPIDLYDPLKQIQLDEEASTCDWNLLMIPRVSLQFQAPATEFSRAVLLAKVRTIFRDIDKTQGAGGGFKQTADFWNNRSGPPSSSDNGLVCSMLFAILGNHTEYSLAFVDEFVECTASLVKDEFDAGLLAKVQGIETRLGYEISQCKTMFCKLMRAV